MESDRILLIIPPFLGGRYFLQPPLGLLWAASFLKREGFIVDLFDLRIKKLSIDEYESIKHKYSYIVICTSELDIVQNYPIDYRLQYTISLCRRIKEITISKVIIVGAIGSIYPREMKLFTGADYIVVGEWEIAVKNIIIDRIKEKSFIQNGVRGIFDTSIQPDFDLVELKNYFGYSISSNNNSYSYYWSIVQASRGCPYNCSFCYNFYGNMIQYRSALDTYLDIKNQVEHGAKTIFFIDNIFGLKASFVYELCDLLINEPLDVDLIVQTRSDLLNEDILRLMKKAGFIGIWLGIESFDNSVLKACKKNNTSMTNKHALKLIQDVGLIPAAFMIQGLPEQSSASTRNDLEFLNNEGIRYNLSSLLLRPGSDLYKKEIEDKKSCISFEQPWKKALLLKGKSFMDDKEADALDVHKRYSRKRPSRKIKLNEIKKYAISINKYKESSDICFYIINCIEKMVQNEVKIQIYVFFEDFFENIYFEEIIKYFSDIDLPIYIFSDITNVLFHSAVLSTLKGQVRFYSDLSLKGNKDYILLDELDLLFSDKTINIAKYNSITDWLNNNLIIFDNVFYL